MNSLFIVDLQNKRTPVDQGRLINSRGASADIFVLKGVSEQAGKIYREPIGAEKIRAMLRSPPYQLHTPKGSSQLAWPTGFLQKPSGEFVGFSMPLMPLDQAVDLESLLVKGARKIESLPQEYAYRLRVARNLTISVHNLHRRKHAIVDLKPSNIFVYKSGATLSMIDCDGYSIYDSMTGMTFPATHYSDDYIAPEAAKKKPHHLGVEQDLFALAVILFQLLNEGIHPYSGRGPSVPRTQQERINVNAYAYGLKSTPRILPNIGSIHSYWPNSTRAMFDRAFSTLTRPSAAQWRKHLDLLINGGEVSSCPNDFNHGKFKSGCPHCFLEKRNKVATTATIFTPSYRNQVFTFAAKAIIGIAAFFLSLTLTASSRFLSPLMKRISILILRFTLNILPYAIGRALKITSNVLRKHPRISFTLMAFLTLSFLGYKFNNEVNLFLDSTLGNYLNAPPSTLTFAEERKGGKESNPADSKNIKPAMKFVSGTNTYIGSPKWDRKPYDKLERLKWVQVEDFEISTYEVSVGEYRKFIKDTNRKSEFLGCYNRGVLRKDLSWEHNGSSQTDQHPVTCVSWWDAVDYADWLTKKVKKAGYNEVYRLPTEEEWELAARGHPLLDIKNYQRYWWGNNLGAEAENCDGCWNFGNSSTYPVGKSGKPNPLGLFDVLGNVREWTFECGGEKRDNCNRFIAKGGSWRSGVTYSRIAAAFSFPRDARSTSLGFRLVMKINE